MKQEKKTKNEGLREISHLTPKQHTLMIAIISLVASLFVCGCEENSFTNQLRKIRNYQLTTELTEPNQQTVFDSNEVNWSVFGGKISEIPSISESKTIELNGSNKSAYFEDYLRARAEQRSATLSDKNEFVGIPLFQHRF